MRILFILFFAWSWSDRRVTFDCSLFGEEWWWLLCTITEELKSAVGLQLWHYPGSVSWQNYCCNKNPAKCEVCGVIWFFMAKHYSAGDIHQKICTVYRPKAMSKHVVCNWVLHITFLLITLGENTQNNFGWIATVEQCLAVKNRIVAVWHVLYLQGVYFRSSHFAMTENQ